MFQSVCISSPDVPVRVPCACPLSLLLLLLPRPDSCSSCPLSPPFLALVHVLLAVSCRRRFLLLVQPCTLQSRVASTSDVLVQGLHHPDVPVRVRCFPGCSSPGCMLLSVSPSSPSPPFSRLLFFVSSLPCSLLLFMFFSPLLAAAVSSSLCSPVRSNPGFLPPGCSSPGALLPGMFQSGFHALVRLPLPPGCSSPGGPVASDAPVGGTGFTPGRSSPGARAMLLSIPSQSRTQPGGRPSWAYSPYLPLERESK